MNENSKSATVTDNLISFSIANVNSLFMLNRVGKRTKQMHIAQKNILLGKFERVATLLLTLNIEQDNDFLELEYELPNEVINYKVFLTALPSNLGAGLVYFFNCPISGKKCRKLFFNGRLFVSRGSLDNPHYSKQTESKKKRDALMFDRKLLKSLEIVLSGLKPYFKSKYKGRVTPKRKKVIQASWYINQFR